MIKCTVCGEPFEGRVDAKYCSDSCRKKASRLSVTKDELSVTSVTDNLVTDKLNVTDNVRDKIIDIDTPCTVYSDKPKEGEKMLNLVKDLKLDLKKDLGISAWTSDGIFILPEITIQQVLNICSLIRAKNGSKRCAA